MRHYTVSIFGAGGNKSGSAYDNGNAYVHFDSTNRKDTFKNIRKHIKESYKYYLKNNMVCANEFRYYCNATCYDDVKKKKIGMHFKIDPKELR